MDKERAAAGVAGPRQSLLDSTMDSGGGSPLSLPQSCEGPQRKAWGLGWPPGSWPNPLLMSGQPEGLSPWPQPYSPGSPSQAKLGAGQPPKPLQAPFPPFRSAHPPHSYPNAETPAPGQPMAPASAGWTRVTSVLCSHGLPWTLTICSRPGPTWSQAGEAVTADEGLLSHSFSIPEMFWMGIPRNQPQSFA